MCIDLYVEGMHSALDPEAYLPSPYMVTYSTYYPPEQPFTNSLILLVIDWTDGGLASVHGISTAFLFQTGGINQTYPDFHLLPST